MQKSLKRPGSKGAGPYTFLCLCARIKPKFDCDLRIIEGV